MSADLFRAREARERREADRKRLEEENEAREELEALAGAMRDWDERWAALRDAAQAGDAQAEFTVGMKFVRDGADPKRHKEARAEDHRRALSYLTRAGQQGIVDAQLELA